MYLFHSISLSQGIIKLHFFFVRLFDDLAKPVADTKVNDPGIPFPDRHLFQIWGIQFGFLFQCF
jgi:hypothetical protein